MNSETYANLIGRVMAMELMLRGLLAENFGRNPDPRVAAKMYFSSMISSIYAADQKPTDMADALIWQGLEEAFEEYEEQVGLRLTRMLDERKVAHVDN